MTVQVVRRGVRRLPFDEYGWERLQQHVDKLYKVQHGDTRYYTETEMDDGQLDDRYYTETETDALLALYLPLAGGTMSGTLNMGDNAITNGGTIGCDTITLVAGESLLAAGASCAVGVKTQLFESVWADEFYVTGAETEKVGSSGAGLLTLTSSTRTEVLGGPLFVGAGSPGHTITGAGDLFVGDTLEVDGIAYFDGAGVYLAATTALGFGLNWYGGFVPYADDGLHWYVHESTSTQNRNIIICDYTERALSFGHSALSANPTLFIHSNTSPASATDEWISFAHDVTNGIIAVGSGALYIGATANQNIHAAQFNFGTGGTTGLSAQNSATKSTGGRALTLATKSAAYTATTADDVIIVDTDTAGAGVTITLPAVAGNTGLRYYIKNSGTGGFDVTVDGDGAETIDGDATQTVIDGNCILVICDGTEWWVV